MQSAISRTNSPSKVTKKPKGKSPKPVDRSPRGIPSPELIRLQEELRNVKSELHCSDLEKARAQAEAAEVRKQLAAVSNQVSETRSRLLDLSNSEDSRIRELRKISLERDKAWQSELEAVQKQKSLDSYSLSSAMNEIKKLKLQLERVAKSEAAQAEHVETAYHELRNIREELSETLVLVESLRNELSECRDSEARTLEMVGNTQMLLDIANATAETLHSETMKSREALDAMSYELERSRAREDELEAAARDLQEELDRSQSNCYGNAKNFVDSETDQVKFVVETTKIGYHEHHLPSEVEVSKHWRSMPRMDDSKEVQKLTEENELLKEKLKKAGEDAAPLLDAARSAEEEALTKLGNVMVEADKNGERAAQAKRQLEAAQAANSEMEVELGRLKVQLDQWRKAAELAATMISGKKDGKATENRGSVEYSHVSDDDDDTEKWRNGNVLKKIGVLWKKGNKKTRGMGSARKLKRHRRRQRWADEAYKKPNLATKWKKPSAGSCHAEGIVLEEIGIEAKQPNSAIRKCATVQLIKNGKKIAAFIPNDGCLNFIEETDEVLIAGFGRKGHAVGDFPSVRFKVVKVSGLS